MPRGSRRSSPPAGRRGRIPGGRTEVESRGPVGRALASTAGQGSLREDLAASLDPVEPRGDRRHRHAVAAGMAPVPQHGSQRPMQRQGVDDQGPLPLGDEPLQRVQQVQPRRGVPRVGRVEDDLAWPMGVGPGGPDGAVPRVTRAQGRPMRPVRPRRSWIRLGRNRPQLIDAPGRAAGWGLAIQLAERPLFPRTPGRRSPARSAVSATGCARPAEAGGSGAA